MFWARKSAVEYKHYGIMLCPSIYSIMVNHQCVLYIGGSRYVAVKAVL